MTTAPTAPITQAPVPVRAAPDDPVARAVELAGTVLFPAAPEVDGASTLPPGHLDRLAAGGFYGLAGPASHDGLGLDFERSCRVVEAIAGGCLSTALVWLQHHHTVASLTFGDRPAQRERWLPGLCRGEIRSGIAFNGIRPGGSTLRATASGDGYELHGETDWVTGWGMLDVLQVAAFDERGDVLYGLVDVVDEPRLRAHGLDLLAGRATGTVRLAFDGVPVPADRVFGVYPPAPAHEVDVSTLRIGAALGLGVTARCVDLLDAPSGPAGELDEHRRALWASDGSDDVLAACAAVQELALRSSAALFVASGSRSVLPGRHAGRLAREALLLSVFGSRPPLRAGLLDRLGTAGDR